MAGQRFVAFFRNVNLGRPGSPTKAQLILAFEKAGGAEVGSFLGQGNATFSAKSLKAAREIADAAKASLKRTCGLKEPVFVRNLKALSKLVASKPYARTPKGADEFAISFVESAIRLPLKIPIVTKRGDAEVFRLLPGAALSALRRIDGRVGNVNALLERLLDVPFTTRTWNTIVRLVESLVR